MCLFLCVSCVVTTSCLKQTIVFNTPQQRNVTSLDVFVLVSDDFSHEQKDDIKRGLALWSFATNGYVNIEILPLEWKSITKHTEKCEPVIVFNLGMPFDDAVKDSNGESVLGITHRRPCSYTTVWLYENELRSSQSWQVTTAHEFGHSLGLKHVEEKSAVMNKFYSDYKSLNCLTLSDMNEFCSIYGCDTNNMNFCTTSLTCM